MIGGHEVDAELDDLEVATGLGLAVGQFDDVRIALRAIEWQGRRVERLEIHGRNVHLRPGLTPVLAAGPVRLAATVASDDLASWVPAAVGRRVEVDIGEDAVARVRWRDRPNLGAVEMDVRAEGPFLVLDPTTLVAGTRRFSGLRRVPPFRLPLVVPGDLVVTDVALAPRSLVVEGHLPEWAEPLSVGDIQQLARRLSPDLDPVILPRAR